MKIITTDVSDVRMYAESDFTILPCVEPKLLHKAMMNAINTAPKNEAIKLRDTFDYKNYIEQVKIWLN